MKECIYYLLAQKKAAHKTKHMSRPVFSCCVHISSHSFQFCHSCHQQLLLEPLFPSTLPAPFYNLASNYWYLNDVKMILPSFHWAKHIGRHGGNSSTRSVGGTSATQTPCELHSILRINPYNWTFPNCNISFIMDQSTNKTTNEWLLQVACRKTYSTLGALLFACQKNKQDLQQLLFVQPTLWVFCQANSKAPKVEQVFPHATCNNHSFVVLFMDWSIMKLMLKFGKVQL